MGVLFIKLTEKIVEGLAHPPAVWCGIDPANCVLGGFDAFTVPERPRLIANHG